MTPSLRETARAAKAAGGRNNRSRRDVKRLKTLRRTLSGYRLDFRDLEPAHAPGDEIPPVAERHDLRIEKRQHVHLAKTEILLIADRGDFLFVDAEILSKGARRGFAGGRVLRSLRRDNIVLLHFFHDEVGRTAIAFIGPRKFHRLFGEFAEAVIVEQFLLRGFRHAFERRVDDKGETVAAVLAGEGERIPAKVPGDVCMSLPVSILIDKRFSSPLKPRTAIGNGSSLDMNTTG